MYGGLFKNADGSALISGDVPHLYHVWANITVEVYKTITIGGMQGYFHGLSPSSCTFRDAYSGVEGSSVAIICSTGTRVNTVATPYAGVFSHKYYLTKWRAFLPSIAGVGSPLLASMRLPQNGYHAIDSIVPTTGGWYVYGLSSPTVSISVSSVFAGYKYREYYVQSNKCGYVLNRAMLVDAAGSVPGYTINAVNDAQVPHIDAYAAYTSGMGVGHNTGVLIKNSSGVEVFKYPASYKPVKARVDAAQIAAPSMLSSGEVSVLGATSGRSVVFFGIGQYVFDRAFYQHSTTCSYGCDGYRGCVHVYNTRGVSVLLRNMIHSSGKVRAIPVRMSSYLHSSYADNSSVVGSYGSPVSSSGGTSSGYRLSTVSNNTDSEYAIAIHV